MLDLIARSLAEDFAVTAFSDSLRAADVLRLRSFDACLYDLCMDPLHGIELLLLTLALDEHVPVLLMSGQATVERAVEALRAGATDLLLKPLRFASLSERIGKAIDRSRLRSPFGRLGAVQEALARAVEAKDPLTQGHSDRVRRMSHRIACELGLSEIDRRTLDRASALHDIGKIGVPDIILRKPSSLSSEEFAVIKKHREIGARILEPVDGLAEARRTVLEHHERWDGSGYPHRLRREEISLPGRILILTEVLDALASERTYKSAWNRAQIEAFFREQSGRHFDPDLTDCFLRILHSDFEGIVLRQAAPPLEAGTNH